MKMDKKMIYDVSEWLLIIGGLNWGLVQFMDTNLVGSLPEFFQIVVYGAVTASAVYLAYLKIMKK